MLPQFFNFFWFEVRFWLKGMMVWVFLGITSFLAFLLVASDNVEVAGAGENIYRNGALMVQIFFGALGLYCGVMTTAFVNSAASRDFSCGTAPIIFSKPIGKVPFLLGRFFGAIFVSLIPLLGISFGMILGGFMPWVNPERIGPIVWGAHFWSFLNWGIPNTFFFGALIFAIAVWTRSAAAAFVGFLFIFIGYVVSGLLIGSLDNEWLASLLDPFGLQPLEHQTKYWTTPEKNANFLPLTGPLLLNRLMWGAVGLLVLGLSIRRFSFAERFRAGRSMGDEFSSPAMPLKIPAVSIQSNARSAIAQTLRQARSEFRHIVWSPIFLVVMSFAAFLLIMVLSISGLSMYGLSELPVTYSMIGTIRASLSAFLLASIVYFAGALVWRERDARFQEIHDALPRPDWTVFVGKLLALLTVVVLVQAASVLIGVASQAVQGYSRFQFSLYLSELFGWDLLGFVCSCVLAMFIHVISPNKYIGYFAFVLFMIANQFLWNLIEWSTNLVQYGDLPSYTYSDLFAYGPYLSGLKWFGAYWFLGACLLALASIVLWPRGKEAGARFRLSEAKRRWRGSLRLATLLTGTAFVAIGSWIFYNTKVLNHYRSSDETEALQVRYEKELRKNENIPQPRVVSVKYEIDLRPDQRAIVFRGTETVANHSHQPIEKLHYALAPKPFVTKLDIEGATLVEDIPELEYQVYALKEPLQPGASLVVTYTVEKHEQGFENQVSDTTVVQNGTFFNNMIAPQLGYQPNRQLQDRYERQKAGLPPIDLMPPLDPEDLVSRGNNYISNNSDWVNVESIISTSPDQIAIAPGSLVREWTEEGRRYFHYKLDHPSINFYAFASGRYEVARDEWKGVQTEVYYHPEHYWNVPRMQRAIRESLKYYIKNFGPYEHKQARIIEFPRTATFAQAFPGTMPYSEGIGFIADISQPDDIDMVFYVVAHEMGHQWWAHQIIGSMMQGATVLSETLSQYSALMVMEQEYGRDMMRKFLKYEMDQYLRGRGQEYLKELPLGKVESSQAYIHYNKGSVAMYQLREMIGEDRINAALRSLVSKWAYKGPPYPTALDLIDALREQTPDDYRYLIHDLFERIVLYDNRAVEATCKELEGGKYEVNLKISCSKREADEKGNESPTDMDDWIEFGAFADSLSGSKFGKTLHRQRVRVQPGEHEYRFTVDKKPSEVGVDPFHLLVDRIPDDNMKKPTQIQ